MDPFLAYARAKQKNIIELIRLLVECESPSDDASALDRFVDLMEDVVAPMARIRTFPHGHMRAEFTLPGSKKSGRILVLGHSDTVWPMGTLRSMPFRQEKGRLWGPGVLDMKSGLAFFVFAMRALRDLDIPVAWKVVLQINADEEVGSGTSRALTEEAARSSDCVLVLKSIEDRASKLVLLVSIEYAKFRRPVVPGDQLRMELTMLKRKASVAKMSGIATVDGVLVAEAEVMCKLADKPE